MSTSNPQHPASDSLPLRIVLIGAECTGKTTLAAALGEAFDEPFSPEYVRLYVNQLNRPLNIDDLDPIAHGQRHTEDQAFAEARRFVFHDTNLLSTLIYARHYFAAQQDWLETLFQSRPYHHYFLCEPDFPWVADPGQREGPHTRSALQEIFRQELISRNLPHTPVTGPLPERIALIQGVLASLIKPTQAPFRDVKNVIPEPPL